MKPRTWAQNRLTKDLDRIVEKYLEDGTPVNRLAEEFSVSRNTMYSFLVREGVKIRGRREARQMFEEQNPDCSVAFVPTTEEIERQKIILRRKHIAERQAESMKTVFSPSASKTELNPIPTINFKGH